VKPRGSGRGRRTRRTGNTASAVAIVLVAGIAPLHVSAQAPRWAVDLNGARIEYDSIAPLNAPSLSALGEWQRPSYFGRLTGSITGFEGSGWSSQARGELAGWTSPLGPRNLLRVELGGSAAGSRHSSGFDAFIANMDARLHVRGRSVGGWAGATLASAKNAFDSVAVRGVVPGAGAWAQTGWVRGTLALSATRLSGETYPEGRLAVSITRGPVDVTGYAGIRGSPVSVPDGDEAWAGASAALWVRANLAIVVAGGDYAADVLQGLPGGRYFSVGLRLTRRRSRPIPITAPAPIVYTPEAARAGSISFEVSGAQTVEIAGDWTEWRRRPLEQDDDGRWLVPASLTPGVYRFNLWVDGSRWVVPEGVAEVDDGYGGKAGLLIISGGS